MSRSGEVRLLPVCGGFFAIIDAEDFDRLSIYTWSLHWKKEQEYVHVFRYEKHDGKYYKRVRLQREVMGKPPKGHCWDHINGNTLDNRRSNIRPATQRQNMQNSRVRRIKDRPMKPKTSVYKGVSKDKCRGRDSLTKPWRARIRVNGRLIGLGYFQTPEEAAATYNKAAAKYFGEFACLNEVKQ